MQLGRSGLVRAKDAVAVGKLMRADWFLLGTEARLKGGRILVLRLVDARTGILRDAGVVDRNKQPSQIADEIGEFVRRSRQAATSAQMRVYLAVGSFEDLSVNNRLADFPAQLHGFLIAAYRNSKATVLEREYVDALLEEVRLDWAGLTDEQTRGALQPMQSAFWLVDGWYQSDERANPRIEVTLEVRRIFGRTKQITLRAPPGGELEQQIKTSIDSVLRQDKELMVPTLMSEVRSQMALGKELARIGELRSISSLQDEQEYARRRRNAQEAIRAFETVLLLEPTNRQAKICLAACLQMHEINELDKAVGYYRDVLEEPVQDEFTQQAERALHLAWTFADPRGTLRWLEAASVSTGNPAAAAFYRNEAERARASLTLKGGGSDARSLAEQRLFGTMTNSFIGSTRNSPTDEFVQSFGTNQAAAADRLAELYPSLKAKAPQLGHYILASIVAVQTLSNAPIVSEFEQLLDQCAKDPSQVFGAEDFWWFFSREIYDWSFNHQRYSLAAKFIENKLRAAARLPNASWGINNDDRITLAFAYLGEQQWSKALQIFETYSNQPVRMETWGPWGGPLVIVSTGQRAEYCRRQLGLTVVADHRQFDIGKPVLHMCSPSTFAADDTGVWLGLNDRLVHLDLNLKTNFSVLLPIDDLSQITTLCVGPSSIWVGTAGAGLFEFDKNTGQAKRFTVNEGLMLNRISCLALADQTLWVGYGDKNRYSGIASADLPNGGLGRLDLLTRKFTSFVPSITSRKAPNRDAPDRPTLQAVETLAVDSNSDVWLATFNQYLRHYLRQKDLWEGSSYSGNCTSLAADKTRVFAGWYSNFSGEKKGPVGISIFDLRNANWSYLPDVPELPAGVVTALQPNGNELWVGGAGYLARFDLQGNNLLNFSYIPGTVERLEINGGYLWAQYNCHLHRLVLGTLR